MLAEEGEVVMADGKMEIDGRFFSVLRGSNAVLRTFNEVLQRGRTRAIAIFME